MNDGRYGMVENGHLNIFGRTPEFKLTTNIAEMARGMGARVFTITRPTSSSSWALANCCAATVRWCSTCKSTATSARRGWRGWAR